MRKSLFKCSIFAIMMLMITMTRAEDCTVDANWKTESERGQVRQIQNVTMEMCRAEYPNFDVALQLYETDHNDDAQMLKIICSKNSPGRNLRSLTNVCGQYFGLQMQLLESCPCKATDPNFALSSLVLKCPDSNFALTAEGNSEEDDSASSGGCAWAGLINVTVGDACNGTSLNRMAYNMGKMAGDVARKMFPKRQSSFFSLPRLMLEKEEQK